MLVPGMLMCDEELEHLVEEIEDYKKSMKQAEKQMKSSTSAFMAAHATTMEVLGEAGKVQYNQRFHSRGLTDIRCMFCTMVFPSYEVRKKTYHQLSLDNIWGYCEYFLYMLQIVVWQYNCNCICICKYMWILYIWKHVTFW